MIRKPYQQFETMKYSFIKYNEEEVDFYTLVPCIFCMQYTNVKCAGPEPLLTALLKLQATHRNRTTLWVQDARKILDMSVQEYLLKMTTIEPTYLFDSTTSKKD